MSKVDLSVEMKVFEQIQNELGESNRGRWVVIQSKELLGIFDTFAEAVQTVEDKLGVSGVLIRQFRTEDPYFPFAEPAVA